MSQVDVGTSGRRDNRAASIEQMCLHSEMSAGAADGVFDSLPPKAAISDGWPNGVMIHCRSSHPSSRRLAEAADDQRGARTATTEEPPAELTNE